MKSHNEYINECQNATQMLQSLIETQTNQIEQIRKNLQTIEESIKITEYSNELRCPDEYDWFDDLNDADAEQCYDEWQNVYTTLETYEAAENLCKTLIKERLEEIQSSINNFLAEIK